MALIKCKECGHKISKKAASCPNCGATSKKKRSNLGCGGLLVVLAILYFGYSNIQGAKDATAQKQLQASQQSKFNKNKNQLLEQMNQFIEDGEYLKAIKAAGAYNTIKDPDLVTLRNKAKELDLVAKVAKIPTAQTKENFDIYEKLIALAPDNEKYKEKHTFYNKKMNRIRSIEKQFSAFDGSHYQFEKYIKSKMKNPDSYEHVKTVYWDKGDHILVQTTYRGTNSFNAVVTETEQKNYLVD
ncbi:zinc ribbon domain-containing protein [Pseudoalteromonas sp. NSLLW218]|uniref:zinc ribbon domain-containing protein n=1 Tax=Pseudoalteromonas sp. NSLLW218 TaxID=2792048 RepID=UPI0018CFB891|nr:zinc ribbon domain-containing protein [Pseudoalteromonas sp. NSLLW218]MBH0088625.1 zinc ribbon domain-containing protein [Pseudoalteromonas sp. NSLLW218]